MDAPQSELYKKLKLNKSEYQKILDAEKYGSSYNTIVYINDKVYKVTLLELCDYSENVKQIIKKYKNTGKKDGIIKRIFKKLRK